ncbi:MAG: AbrB/MazE/SpoVT family DNA-binding domain-containing protein [Planctomycetota bacterium]
MSEVQTTRMSSKGQVVIPETVRKKLGLKPGARFVVVGRGDSVVLKTLRMPNLKQFDSLLAEARREARNAGLKRSDILRAIARVRGRK